MNFKYLILVFLCLLVLGSVSYSIGTEPYFQVVNTSMRYGASPISSTLNQYVALVRLDTSNASIFNTTHPVGLAFSHISDNSTRLRTELDSGWGTANTLLWVGNINQTNSSQIIAWADKDSAEAVNYSVAQMWQTAYYTAVYHGNNLLDSSNANTIVISFLVGTITYLRGMD